MEQLWESREDENETATRLMTSMLLSLHIFSPYISHSSIPCHIPASQAHFPYWHETLILTLFLQTTHTDSENSIYSKDMFLTLQITVHVHSMLYTHTIIIKTLGLHLLLYLCEWSLTYGTLRWAALFMLLYISAEEIRRTRATQGWFTLHQGSDLSREYSNP